MIFRKFRAAAIGSLLTVHVAIVDAASIGLKLIGVNVRTLQNWE